MLTLFLLFSLGFSVQAQHLDTPFLFEQDAKELQAEHGIHQMNDYGGSTLYLISATHVHLLVSKQTFTTLAEARAFCAGNFGFSLANSDTLKGVMELGMPFPELWPVSVIRLPVLETRQGLTNGIVYWSEATSWEQTHSGVAHDDSLFCFEDIDGEVDWNFQSITKINARLSAADTPPLNLPAICTDEH